MFLPITLNTVQSADLNHLAVEGTMIRDFGPWKKGEARTLVFDFDKGVCEEYDEDGRVKNIVHLYLEVIRPSES